MLWPSKLPASVTPNPGHELGGVVAQHRGDLIGGPHVEPALLALGVGVEGRVEAAAVVAQIAQHESDGLVQHLPEAGAASYLPGVQVQPGEQGVVVQHLLEVGHNPLGVHRVAAETAAQVVVDPPRGHGVQRVDHHVENVLVAAVQVGAQQHLLAHGLGELGRPPEAAPGGVVLLAQRRGGLAEGFRAGSGGGSLGVGLDQRGAVQ